MAEINNSSLFIISSILSKRSVQHLKVCKSWILYRLKFEPSALVEDHFVITITDTKVEILNIDLSDPEKSKMYLERRCFSALKYPTLDGDEYYVWKLGDRKMVLRKENGVKYLSLYQSNEYGLPNEYITFVIVE